MSTPTLENFATGSGHHPKRIRAACVRFCDREDAEMFLQWLQARSISRGSAITLGVFVATAADAFVISSALTGAEFAEIEATDLPDAVRDQLLAPILPPAIGPFESVHGWEIMHVMSMR